MKVAGTAPGPRNKQKSPPNNNYNPNNPYITITNNITILPSFPSLFGVPNYILFKLEYLYHSTYQSTINPATLTIWGLAKLGSSRLKDIGPRLLNHHIPHKASKWGSSRYQDNKAN